MLRQLWERLKPHIGLILAGVASAGIAYYLFTRPASKSSGAPSTVTFPATGGGSGGGGSSGGSTAPAGPTTPMEWLTQTFANLIAAPPSTGLPTYATSGNLNELLNYMAGRSQYVSADAVSLWNWLVKVGGAPPGGFLPPSSGPPVVTPPVVTPPVVTPPTTPPDITSLWTDYKNFVYSFNIGLRTGLDNKALGITIDMLNDTANKLRAAGQQAPLILANPNAGSCAGEKLLPGQMCLNGIPTYVALAGIPGSDRLPANANASKMTANQLTNLVTGR